MMQDYSDKSAMTPEPATTGSAADEIQAERTVAKLRRESNLAVFVIVVTALAAMMVVRVSPFMVESASLRAALRIARIVAPFLVLGATAFWTHRVMVAHLRRLGGETATLGNCAPQFARAKRVATRLLLLAGVFGTSGLAVARPRILDWAGAVIPLLFLLLARPGIGGLASFAGLVATMQEDEQKKDV